MATVYVSYLTRVGLLSAPASASQANVPSCMRTSPSATTNVRNQKRKQ